MIKKVMLISILLIGATSCGSENSSVNSEDRLNAQTSYELMRLFLYTNFETKEAWTIKYDSNSVDGTDKVEESTIYKKNSEMYYAEVQISEVGSGYQYGTIYKNWYYQEEGVFYEHSKSKNEGDSEYIENTQIAITSDIAEIRYFNQHLLKLIDGLMIVDYESYVDCIIDNYSDTKFTSFIGEKDGNITYIKVIKDGNLIVNGVKRQTQCTTQIDINTKSNTVDVKYEHDFTSIYGHKYTEKIHAKITFESTIDSFNK